ncbi:MAG: response regulator [Bacillota bacterium]
MPGNVLIIDDDEKARKLYRVILEQSGYSCIEAPAAPEGIKIAEHSRVDLIILDLQLPEMDGLAAARLLKAYGPTKAIPVIAVTALAMPDDREEVMAAGADAYLPKPIKRKEFLQIVQYFLEGEGKIRG